MTQIPESTVERLPVYLRALARAKEERMSVVSSTDIARLAGTNAAQVRKDLSYLGELGTRGIGYDVGALSSHLSRRLGLNGTRRVAVVGAGRLGTALISYIGLVERGFEVVAVFDSDPTKVGMSVGGVSVRDVADMERGLCEDCVDVAIIATPADVAQSIADRMVAAGIRAVINFAPVALDVLQGVRLRQVDLSAELQILSFYLNEDA